MQCDVILTADEFKTIHNTLWELDRVIDQLDNIVKDSMVERLHSVSQTLRNSLKGAYEQERTVSKTRMNYYQRVQEECKYQSVWSISTIDDFYTNHPYLAADQVIYEGKVAIINGPNWIDLWDAADRVIKATGDLHHIYIESFVPGPKVGDAKNVLCLVTGS